MKSQSLILSLALACGAAVFAGEPAKFDEVYKLLRDNLPGATESELNEAAVKGLIGELSPRASLAPTQPQDAAPLLIQSAVYEGAFACCQIGRVDAGLAESLAQAIKGIQSTNAIKGVILDLRYAVGTNYVAAAAAADLFVDSEQPLLNWGAESAQSTSKTNAIAVPVAVLLNKQSRGAAEALAAALREVGAGLLLGSQTAGEACLFKTFALSDGTSLRIAAAPVKLADGTGLDHGVSPDISVPVDAAEEKALFANPYVLRKIVAPGTNDASQADSRINEAELVRMQRMGYDAQDAGARRKNVAPTGPVIGDPVLGRALDLLKGLTVVRRSSAAPK